MPLTLSVARPSARLGAAARYPRGQPTSLAVLIFRFSLRTLPFQRFFCDRVMAHASCVRKPLNQLTADWLHERRDAVRWRKANLQEAPMSYAQVSSSSLELLPVLSNPPRAIAARRPGIGAIRSSAVPRQVRYRVVEHVETALYLAIALGFAVAVYGFIGLFHF